MKIRKIINGIIATSFFTLILLSLVFFNWKQGVVSETENRKLATFPNLFNEEGSFSETLLGDLTSWFEDNLGFRDTYLNISSRIEYNVFGRSPSYKVELGKEGWLFYTQNQNLNIADGTYEGLDEENLKKLCERLVIINNKLKSQGIDFVLIFPASKVSIYPEYIQSGDYGIIKTPADIVADYIEECTDINVIRIKDALIKEKDACNDLLYKKTDTHWNAKGIYVGYKTVVTKLNEFGILNSEPINVQYTEKKITGDLSTMIGNSTEKYMETVPVFALNSLNAVCIEESTDLTKMREIERRLNFKQGESGIFTNNISAPSMLLYADSMFLSGDEGSLVSLLAENTSRLSYYWGTNISQDAIDFANPDVICIELGERYLSSLINSVDDYSKTEYTIDSDNNVMNIYYRDDYAYENMWFPVWSVANGQDDLYWYQAKRLNDGRWHVKIELSNHNHEKGLYNIHFYSGTDTVEMCIYTDTYQKN